MMLRAKKKTLLCYAGIVIVLVLALTALPVMAKEAKLKMGTGKTYVSAEASYSGEYQTNIFYKNNNTKDDFVHHLQGKVELGYNPSYRNYVKLGVLLDWNLYSRYSGNNNINPSAYLNTAYYLPSGFYVIFDDNFHYLNTNAGNEQSYNLGLFDTRYSNNADLTLGYKFADRYSIEGIAGNYVNIYLKDNSGGAMGAEKWQTRYEYYYGLAFVYDFTAKTSAYAKVRQTQAVYPNQNDGIDVAGTSNDFNSGNSQDNVRTDFLVGVRFKPFAKLNGDLAVGAGHIGYTNAANRFGTPYQDHTTIIAEGGLSYNVNRGVIAVKVNRYFTASADEDGQSLVLTGIKLTYNQSIGRRLTFKANGGASNTDFLAERPGYAVKGYNTYDLGVGLDFQVFNWLLFGVGYGVETRSPTGGYSGQYDYTLQKYIATVKVNI